MLSGKIAYFRASVAFDSDALAYLTAVEAADGQALEAAVRTAINSFVVGCKADGIWSAIKASCILAGARTLTGALVPLVGSAPTNFNFASGDYNRKTGLLGNGSTKYLNSNRAGNAESQNNVHLSAYVTTANSLDVARAYMGNGQNAAGATHFGTQSASSSAFSRVRNSPVASGATNSGTATGFFGVARASDTTYSRRISGATSSVSQASDGVEAANYLIFNRLTTTFYANGRLSFYSIGSSLDLSLLDSRVTTLYNAIGAAIP